MNDKIRDIARELNSHLETRARETGEQFITLRDDAPEWCLEVLRLAHGDMLPDDRIYEMIASAIDAIADGRAGDDGCHEWCDGQVDAYNGDRASWLAEDPHRGVYCDLAVSEGLVADDADIWDRLGAGQYVEAYELFGRLWHALSERASEIDSEDDSST